MEQNSVYPSIFETLVKWRRWLHSHAETGFAEHRTSAFLANKLRDLGCEVHEGIAGTGLVAVVPGADRTRSVGYRADMDALPGVEAVDVPWKSKNGCMHACGHDIHMTIALGLAWSLIRSVHKPSCDVAFVFQPNEEGAPGDFPGGAETMCREGVLERFHIRRMMALHCDPSLETGTFGISRHAAWAASGRFVVTVEGCASHAAYPERGHDAIWAASTMIPAIYAAVQRRRPRAPEIVSVCRIEGGTAFNVISAKARFEGTLRAADGNAIDELGEILRETVQGVSAICGVTAHVEVFHGADSVINDGAMARLALDVLGKSGKVCEISMSMASEDFSHYASKVPGLYAMIGVRPHHLQQMPPLHADNFCPDEGVIAAAVPRVLSLLTEMLELDA